MVHRDIKPGNIILCTRGDVPDVAKVVDFGLVRELEQSGQSAHEIVSGTPAYLAPEAITDPDQIGPASDLYAVGAVGYYLLTGERVFDGKTAVDVCTQHVTAAPVPPSKRTDQEIPEALETLILACLEKSPGQRPSSADELAELLGTLDCAAAWTVADSKAWWQSYQRPSPAATDADTVSAEVLPAAERTMTVDIRAR
jgi:serine/threonine protein kinase